MGVLVVTNVLVHITFVVGCCLCTAGKLIVSLSGS